MQPDVTEEDRQALLAKLAELRSKKAQVEQLISLINSFRGATGVCGNYCYGLSKVCTCNTRIYVCTCVNIHTYILL